MRRGALILSVVLVAIGFATMAAFQSTPRGGYVLEHDAEVARTEPGTHNGGGETVGYSFFADTPDLGLVFRKRALKPGSGIGYHEKLHDEIYYVLSGRGMMRVDDETFEIGPGAAVLTRPQPTRQQAVDGA